MDKQNWLTNAVLVFWFGWWALAGVIITGIINWIFSAHLYTEDVIMIGATVGIITGGVAALTFFVIGKSRKLEGFGEKLRKTKQFFNNKSHISR